VTRPHPFMTRRIAAIGLGVSRYGLAFLLVLIGGYKFFPFEAEGIRPLVGSSPCCRGSMACWMSREWRPSSGHSKLPSAL
jgi:uncharacterized membrane protein YkgB